MLVVDPEKRLTISQIVKHKWLSDAEPPLQLDVEEDQRLNNTVIEHMLQVSYTKIRLMVNCRFSKIIS